MKKTFFFFLVLLTANIFAQEVISGRISSNRTLLNTKTYLLSGFVRVDSGVTLTIQPGTVIFGENTTQGTLIVNKGGKILAQGTSTQPIVFTSEFAKVGSTRTPTYGDWGGVIILGRAPINPAGGTAAIEGPGDPYGGPDPEDNSGILSYVRIEYPGIAFSLNNEINGLTMGGVGRGTQIDHVQVSYSGDDSFEWFGGTVNCKYLIAYRGWDDDFDTDFGFSGKLQYLVGLRDPAIADQSGSNGFESDNDGTGSSNTPVTSPTWYNVTLVGPKKFDTTTVNSNFRRGMHLRRNSQNKIDNALILGWGTGILFDGTKTISGVGTTNYVRNSIIAGSTKTVDTTGSNGSFAPVTYFTGAGGRVLSTSASALLTDPFNLTAPNFVPQTGSPALTGASTPPADGFFDAGATYVGAFGTTDWTAGWAKWVTPQYITSVDEKVIAANGYALAQNYPNPFNPSTMIKFSVPVQSGVKLEVFDQLGRSVAVLLNETVQAGDHSVDFTASGLSSGIYVYRLTAGNISLSKKLSVLK